ncbi:MAG: galactokinase family protein, partial [Desulfocapsaceae bacterium]
MTCTLAHLNPYLSNDKADSALIRLYGRAALGVQKNRYLRLLKEAEQRLSGSRYLLASAPGRTELGGNHTDHNNGRVLASAVDLDCVAAVAPNRDNRVVLYSGDYPEPISVDLSTLNPEPGERGSPEALIRGIGSARNRRGSSIQGFKAMVDSTCKPGTGLSSSAAFAVLIGGIFASLEKESLDPVQLAR